MTGIGFEKLPDTSTKKLDDLTAIKGIGEITQQWLRETFSVRTYHDLAGLSVDAIEARLKAEGKITSRSKVEEWIAQSKTFTSSTSPPIYTQQLAALESEEWPRLATFVVAFEERQVEGKAELQIKAEHHEADEWQVWKGIQLDELSQWMLRQLGDRAFQPTPIQQAVQPTQEKEQEQPEAADKLQQYIAKARQLAGQVIASHASITARQMPLPPAVEPTLLVPSSEESLYSDKLQQYITKAHNLAGKGS